MYAPPEIIETEVFARLPDKFRRKDPDNAWAIVNRRGVPVDSFLEGPSFDRDGQLYIVDIPYGRIFRISPSGEFTLITEYDGEPNGLKIANDGRIVITDYRHGLMLFDPASGKVSPLLERRWSETLQGRQRSGVRAQWRHLLHRPGPDRHARSDRARVPPAGRRHARSARRQRSESRTAWCSTAPSTSSTSPPPAATASGACR